MNVYGYPQIDPEPQKALLENARAILIKIHGKEFVIEDCAAGIRIRAVDSFNIQIRVKPEAANCIIIE